MSGTTIAAVWPIGSQIVAQVLGLPLQHYRPTGANNPTGAGALLGTLPVWITADANLKAAKAMAYGKPVAYAAVDPTKTQVGDYLVGPMTLGGPTETFFIASQDLPAPIQVVRCNQVLTFARPSGVPPILALQSNMPVPPDRASYGGDKTAEEAQLMASWPAAVLDKTRGEMGETKLPGDVRLPWVEILLPDVCGVELRSSDLVLDAQPIPSRYTIGSTERTNLGWRLKAFLANP